LLGKWSERNRRIAASDEFEVVQSGRWDSNPRRPAWENPGNSVAEIPKVLVFPHISVLIFVSQSFAQHRVFSRGFAVSKAQTGKKRQDDLARRRSWSD
jgi:hypothetical protein